MAIKIAEATKKAGLVKQRPPLISRMRSPTWEKSVAIGLDPQHNSTTTYGATIQDTYTIVDVLKRDCTAKEAIQTTPLGDIIAGDGLMAQEEITSTRKSKRNPSTQDFNRCRKRIRLYHNGHAPNLGSI